jgi:hypothetical protein
LRSIRKLPGLEGMSTHGRNQRTGRRVNKDGQLMLELGCPHPPQRLPEPNRSQCVTLLSRMLLCAISRERKSKTNIQP